MPNVTMSRMLVREENNRPKFPRRNARGMT